MKIIISKIRIINTKIFVICMSTDWGKILHNGYMYHFESQKCLICNADTSNIHLKDYEKSRTLYRLNDEGQ